MNNLSQRMDQLPITHLHRIAITALAFAYFFELADLNTFAYAAPGIIGAWHIPVHAVALITATSFGGMFIGGTFGGIIAHRIGRKPAFILSILIYTIFSLLNAASWNVISLAVFRFLTGIGLSGMTVVANVYISEFFPARVRGKYLSMIFTLGLIGIPATAWIALPGAKRSMGVASRICLGQSWPSGDSLCSALDGIAALASGQGARKRSGAGSGKTGENGRHYARCFERADGREGG